MMKMAGVLAMAVSLVCLPGHAQSVATVPSPSAFEVASVHPCPATHGYTSLNSFPADRISFHNANLEFVIAIAFAHDSSRIKGPDWLDSCYNFDAVVGGGQQLTREQMEPLLQKMLKERFHLAFHHESKLASGFALVIAKGGPKLQPAKEGARPKGVPGFTRAQILPGRFDGWGISVQTLAGFLDTPIGAPTVDKTGLAGSYDITLRYAPTNDPNSPLPSIFTAVQEQLGLKLQSAKVPVDYLVIDHIDRTPTEN